MRHRDVIDDKIVVVCLKLRAVAKIDTRRNVKLIPLFSLFLDIPEDIYIYSE